MEPTISVLSSARPYPWPYHGQFDPKRAALIVAVDDAPAGEALERLSGLASACREASILVVQLTGAAMYRLPFAADVTVDRPRLSGFYGTSLDLELRAQGRTDLLISGFPFELGADSTMREANDLGYECLAIEDVCSAADEDTFAGAIRSVQMSGGIFGAIATSDEVLALIGRTL